MAQHTTYLKNDKNEKLTIKDARLFSELNDGVQEFFIDVTYNYETLEYEKELHIPKIKLPLNSSSLALIHDDGLDHMYRGVPFYKPIDRYYIKAGTECQMPVSIEYDEKYGQDIAYTEKLIREKTRDMTISEIEKKLGYKIRIVKEK